MAAFTDAGRSLGPREILEVARQTVPSLDLATVYRTLRGMGETGMPTSIALSGEPPRFQLRQAEAPHHHHFRCNHCRAVFCMEGCVKGLKNLPPQGFRMTGPDITLYGLCRESRA